MQLRTLSKMKTKKPIFKTPLEALRWHVSGAIARGEGEAIVNKPAFYEVNLSNCDGLNATLHIYSDGTHSLVKGSRYAMRKLIPLFRDEEAPGFVKQWFYDRGVS